MKRLIAPFVLLLALAIGRPVNADVVTINFDNFANGFYGPTFLSSYGISDIVIGGSSGAAGVRILDFAGHLQPSAPNLLIQHHTSLDSGQAQSLTFEFSTPLESFSLDRLGSNVSSTPAWSATFYDDVGGTLGTFGDATWQNTPPIQNFSFDAPSGTLIKKMKLESVWTVTTFRNIPVDNFILTQVPEPTSAYALFGIAMLGMSLRRRQR